MKTNLLDSDDAWHLPRRIFFPGGAWHRLSTNRFEMGFSLIEIMAALTILGIVVGLVAVNVTGSLSRAKRQSAIIEMSTLSGALEEYRRDCHRYPTTGEGLKVLVEKSAKCKNWKPGGYLAKSKISKDPWDNDYVYYSPAVQVPGAKYEIISYGADAIEGGSDNDADLNSNTTD